MILLDTHVWLWWQLGYGPLSAREHAALGDSAARGEVLIAAISLWEAQVLHTKGRLALDRPFEMWLRQAASADVVQVAALDVDVVVALDRLPKSFHGDPADRIIAATAKAHGYRLATHDRAMRRSRAVTLWRP